MFLKKINMFLPVVVAFCSAGVTHFVHAGERDLEGATASNCFSDVDIVVQVKNDKTGESSFLADKFVSHGLKTSLSGDEYIDKTIFSNGKSRSVFVYCDDESGDNCSTEDKSIYDDEIGLGCYGVMTKDLHSIAMDVR